MQEILKYGSTILDIALLICFIIFFYLSIKKAFLKEEKGKRKIFFMSLLTNPFFLFLVSFVVSITVTVIIYGISKGTEFLNDIKHFKIDTQFTLTYSIIGCFVFVLLIIIFSLIIGKKLKAPNVSLVTFIYLMFAVITALSGEDSSRKTDEYLIQSYSMKVFSNVILIIALFFWYHFVIKALSKLTDRKRTLNWRMFVLPPAVFLPFYYLFDVLSYFFGGFTSTVCVQILSIIILYLFIWAFYVIIKNINATNDAIEAKDNLKKLSVEVMEALAHTIDAKDKYTNGHSIRVANYSRMIAQKMELSQEMCDNIYYMGLLHDIGKIGVPNEIINKPAKLTDSEYGVIKTHPVIGYDILSEIKSNSELSKGAKWHHERYDGNGYPDGLSGEDIPIESRIISVADSYDAMTSNRSYRDFLPQEKVRSEIEKNIGTQFDPKAAKSMIEIIDEDVNYELHE